jgi:LysM repeat protein
MKYPFPVMLCALVAAVCMCGCASVSSEDRSILAGIRSDLDALQEDVEHVNNRLDEVNMAQDRLRVEMARMGDTSALSERDLASRFERLETSIKAVDDARIRDKKEIVDTLSKKISDIINKHRSVSPTGEYYEHTVQEGETLSKIANDYGVTVDAIVEATGLGDPDRISAGQVVFIPR